MGCTKIGHIHQWPTSGRLIIQRCETRCNFCQGEAALKDWKYAWFLRRHVRAIHVKKGKGEYPRLIVEEGWDERNPRKSGKQAKMKQESDKDDAPTEYIAQPIYDEQREYGMAMHPAFVDPAELMLNNGVEFDFNNFIPFPAFAHEDPALGGEHTYSATNFHGFLEDATGCAGLEMLPSGTLQYQLDGDGVPIIEDYDLPEFTFGNEEQENPYQTPPPTSQDATHIDQFYFSDYSSSPHTPLSERPIAEIFDHGTHDIDPDTQERIMGYLSVVSDEMTEQGVDTKQLITCVGQFTRLLARSLEVDSKPTIDAKGEVLHDGLGIVREAHAHPRS